MVLSDDASLDEAYAEPSRRELETIEPLDETPLVHQRFNHRILSKKEVYGAAYAMRAAVQTMSQAALFPSAAGAHLVYRIARKPAGYTHIVQGIWESQEGNLAPVQPLLDHAGRVHTVIGALLERDDWTSAIQLEKLREARLEYQSLFPSHTLRAKTLTLLLEGSEYPSYPGLFRYAQVLEGKITAKGTSPKELRKIIATEAGATPDELILLAHEAHQAEEVYLRNRNQLLEHNQRLVWGYACKIAHARRYGSGNTLDADDLWGAGQEGLIRAVERFNPDRNYQFSTYATWWIRQSISRYLADTGSTIRLPVHVQEKLNKLGKWQRGFHHENKRYPTDAEIATHFEVKEDYVRAYAALLKQRTTLSLDSPLGDSEEDTFHHIIADRALPSPFEGAAQGQLREQLEGILATLTQRERHIIRERFGLNETGESHTLEEVAVNYQVTRERIRQIEAKALKKLRHPTRANQLRTEYEKVQGINGW